MNDVGLFALLQRKHFTTIVGQYWIKFTSSLRPSPFTRETICVERVFATATCPSVCSSVTTGIVIKTERAIVMISSPFGSPMISGKVRLVEKFARGHPERGRFMRLGGFEQAILAIFRSISRRISETVQHRTKVTIEH